MLSRRHSRGLQMNDEPKSTPPTALVTSDKIRLRPRSPETWTRIYGEPEEAYQAFLSYRNQAPPRDIRRVHVHNIVVPISQVSAWSKAWKWVTRTKLYDQHFDLLGIAERERVTISEAERIAKAHADVLHRAFELIAREVTKLSALSEATDLPAVKPNELTRMMSNVVKLQRLMLGESTAKVEFANGRAWEKADLETLEELDHILEKVGVGR